MVLPQQFDQRFGQHDPTVCLLGQLGEPVNEMPMVGGSERHQFQPRLQFQQVLAPGFRPLGILRPDVRLDTQLVANDVQQGSGRLRVSRQSKAWIAQVAQLYREAEPVVAAVPLTDQRQVGFGKGVMLNEFVVGGWEGERAGALSGRQQIAARHDQSSVFRYWYRVSRLMPNSRASCAFFSPAAARCRNSATRSGASAFLRPR